MMKPTIQGTRLACVAVALAGSALAFDGARQDAAPSRAGLDPRESSPEVQLELRITEQSRWTYVVRRPVPPSNGASEPTARAEGAPLSKALRIDIEPRDLALDDEAEILLGLTLRPIGPIEGEEDSQQGSPARLALRIDRTGKVLALEAEERGNQAAAMLPMDELRTCLEWILGSELHGKAIRKGVVLEIGQGSRKATKAVPAHAKGDLLPLQQAFLLLDEARGDDLNGSLRFTLHCAAEDERPGAESPRVGEASFDRKDGMLSRLVCQPAPREQAGRRPVDWMVIERLDR